MISFGGLFFPKEIWKGNRSGEEGGGGAERRGGREGCSQYVLYDRRIKKKNNLTRIGKYIELASSLMI